MSAPSTAYRNELRANKPLAKFASQFIEKEYQLHVAKEAGSGALLLCALVGISLGVVAIAMSFSDSVYGIAAGGFWLMSGTVSLFGFLKGRDSGVNRDFVSFKVAAATLASVGIVISAPSNVAAQSVIMFLPLAILAQAAAVPARYSVSSVVGLSVFQLVFSIFTKEADKGLSVVLSGIAVGGCIILIDTLWRRSYLQNMLYRAEMVIDPTTLVGNGGMFMSHLSRVRRWGRRSKTSTSLLFFKIDSEELYLKKYSTKQHEEVKIAVAKQLSDQCTRPLDEFCHIDSECFSMIAFGCSKGGSIALAKRMREQVESLAIPTKVSPKSQVITVSVGVMYVSHEVQTATRILVKQGRALADQAMTTPSSIKCSLAIGSGGSNAAADEVPRTGSTKSAPALVNKVAVTLEARPHSADDSVVSIGSART